MASLQPAFETGSPYHIVARRATGELVTVSEHADLRVAKKFLTLIKAAGHCREIFIERDGRRLLRHRDE